MRIQFYLQWNFCCHLFAVTDIFAHHIFTQCFISYAKLARLAVKATIVLHSGQVMSARSAPMPRNSCLGTTPFFVGSRVKRVRKLFSQTATALNFGELICDAR